MSFLDRMNTFDELITADIFFEPYFKVYSNQGIVVFQLKDRDDLNYSFMINLETGHKLWKNYLDRSVPFSEVFEMSSEPLKEKMVFHLVTLRESPGSYVASNQSSYAGPSYTSRRYAAPSTGSNPWSYSPRSKANIFPRKKSAPKPGIAIKARVKKNKRLSPSKQKELDAQCERYLHGVRIITSCHNPSCPGVIEK